MPQRSPIIFGLLLAATAAIDLVAVFWIFESNLGQDQAIALFLSLACGQLSLLCVWAVVDRKLIKSRWLAPVGAALLISVVMTWADAGSRAPFDLETLGAINCLLLLHVGSLLALLWFVVPSAWISSRGASGGRRTQFSTLQLLILMTCIAVLLSATRAIDQFEDQWIDIATFCFANAILLCGTLAFLKTRWPLPLRLAGCVAFAICISAIADWTRLALADSINAWAFFIVQAVVIVLWLCFYLPNRDASGSDPESMLPLGIA